MDTSSPLDQLTAYAALYRESLPLIEPVPAGTIRPFWSVLIPTFNPSEALLTETLHSLLQQDPGPEAMEILVVDDGSADRTAEVVEELSKSYPVRLVKHEVNRGLGAAISTAVTTAVEGLYDDDIVVTMDADNTHPPQLISRMVPMIREGRDIVIASRFEPGGQVVGLSRFREVLSLGASWMMRLCFGVRGCKDYTCGYRAYRAGILRQAQNRYHGQLVRESGFASMAELLLNISKLGVVIGEVPLLLRYDLKKGDSKMRIGRTIYRTIAMVLRHRFGS